MNNSKQGQENKIEESTGNMPNIRERNLALSYSSAQNNSIGGLYGYDDRRL